jgi:hypothetical protein
MLPFFALILAAQPAGFTAWLDAIAQRQLDARAAMLARIETPAQARERQRYIRESVLRQMGGLPEYRGPLNARVTGVEQRAGFRIEKLHFESLPGIHVTANLYLPAAPGRHPAVLHPMGHWEEGKAAAQLIAANLARKGFAVLAYDPVGQGERQQSYEPRTGRSLAGGSVAQHFINGAAALLVGESFARYRIFDGIRALDYLVTRPEVDASRIGCTGCSGGGTLTAYLSALDDRIKVAAPSCYITSFRQLFAGSVGDSEQSLPGFLAAGLDLPDWIALAAPKPYQITSTKEDFFPLEGARQAFEEAQRFYKALDADGRVDWVVGPGGHGTPREVREGIYRWMIRWLKDGKGEVAEEAVELLPDIQLRAAPGGQVATGLRSRDLSAYIAEQARLRRRPGTLEELRAELARLSKETEPDPPLQTAWLEPTGTPRNETVLVVETGARPEAQGQEFARQGYRVLRVHPRGLPRQAASYDVLAGDFLGNTRAWLVGLNLPALRARDIARAARLVPPGQPLKAYARGVPGVWLLMAAALEPRIGAVWLDGTPASLWSAIEAPIHNGLHDAAIPGFALRWDLDDLRRLLAPRQLIWRDPSDWMGNVIRLEGAHFRYRTSLQPAVF